MCLLSRPKGSSLSPRGHPLSLCSDNGEAFVLDMRQIQVTHLFIVTFGTSACLCVCACVQVGLCECDTEP